LAKSEAVYWSIPCAKNSALIALYRSRYYFAAALASKATPLDILLQKNIVTNRVIFAVFQDLYKNLPEPRILLELGSNWKLSGKATTELKNTR
jgi:hypothetical protein